MIQAAAASGAIDVVAIRHPDGRLECSPFHVKLAKGTNMHRDRSKIVKLKVNGKSVPLSMKLGPAGEAFFVERTRDKVRQELRTSPPGSPIYSPVTGGLESHEEHHQATAVAEENLNGNEKRLSLGMTRNRSRSWGDLSTHSEAMASQDLTKSAGETSLSIGDGEIGDDVNKPISRRQRSKSDMSNFSSWAPNQQVDLKVSNDTQSIAAKELPSSLVTQGHSSSSFTSSSTTTALDSFLPDNDVPLLTLPPPLEVSQPAKAAQAWTWTWGALPVKSAPLAAPSESESEAAAATTATSAISLHSVPVHSVEIIASSGEARGPPMPPMPSVSEVYEANISNQAQQDGGGNGSYARSAQATSAFDSDKGDDDPLNKNMPKSSPTMTPHTTKAEEEDEGRQIRDKIAQAHSQGTEINIAGGAEASSTPSPFLNPPTSRLSTPPPFLAAPPSRYSTPPPSLDSSGPLRGRIFSLCGHILSQEPGAPEPMPRTSRELRAVLASYGVSAAALSLQNMADPTVVAILDDFLLPVEVARLLLGVRSLRAHSFSSLSIDAEEEVQGHGQGPVDITGRGSEHGQKRDEESRATKEGQSPSQSPRLSWSSPASGSSSAPSGPSGPGGSSSSSSSSVAAAVLSEEEVMFAMLECLELRSRPSPPQQHAMLGQSTASSSVSLVSPSNPAAANSPESHTSSITGGASSTNSLSPGPSARTPKETISSSYPSWAGKRISTWGLRLGLGLGHTSISTATDAAASEGDLVALTSRDSGMRSRNSSRETFSSVEGLPWSSSDSAVGLELTIGDDVKSSERSLSLSLRLMNSDVADTKESNGKSSSSGALSEAMELDPDPDPAATPQAPQNSCVGVDRSSSPSPSPDRGPSTSIIFSTSTSISVSPDSNPKSPPLSPTRRTEVSKKGPPLASFESMGLPKDLDVALEGGAAATSTLAGTIAPVPFSESFADLGKSFSLYRRVCGNGASHADLLEAFVAYEKSTSLYGTWGDEDEGAGSDRNLDDNVDDVDEGEEEGNVDDEDFHVTGLPLSLSRSLDESSNADVGIDIDEDDGNFVGRDGSLVTQGARGDGPLVTQGARGDGPLVTQGARGDGAEMVAASNAAKAPPPQPLQGTVQAAIIGEPIAEWAKGTQQADDRLGSRATVGAAENPLLLAPSSRAVASSVLVSNTVASSVSASASGAKAPPLSAQAPPKEVAKSSSGSKGPGSAEEEDEGNTDEDHLSLEDIPYEAICPEPAAGDFYDSDTDSYLSLSLEEGEPGAAAFRKYRYRKVLVPSQDNLQMLELKDGENEIVFELAGSPPIHSQLFVWPAEVKIVVTDIEGAITVKKAAGGVWGAFLGPRSEVHTGVAQLLTNIQKQGYCVLYIAQNTSSSSTKDHLAKVVQGTGTTLPPGPVFQSPDSLVRAFGADRTDLFKAAALRGLKGLCAPSHNPYYASFGTRERDTVAFARCGVPEGRIFLVDQNGEIRNANRTFKKSFHEVNSCIEEMFPPVADFRAPTSIQQKVKPPTDDTYSDFNFWKIPLPIID